MAFAKCEMFFSMPSEGLTYTDIKPFWLYIPQKTPQTFYVFVNIICFYIEINTLDK